jgi:hypothetical protein
MRWIVQPINLTIIVLEKNQSGGNNKAGLLTDRPYCFHAVFFKITTMVPSSMQRC